MSAKAGRDGDVFADADVRKCLCVPSVHISCVPTFFHGVTWLVPFIFPPHLIGSEIATVSQL